MREITQHSTWYGSERKGWTFISYEVRGGYYYITWEKQAIQGLAIS